jgi:mannose-6-phosphate isomerase class I
MAGRVKKKILLKNKSMEIRRMIKCKYFNLNEIIMEKNKQKWYNIKNAVVIIVIKGKLNIIYQNKIFKLKTGESALLPFKIGEFLVKTAVKTKFIFTEIK